MDYILLNSKSIMETFKHLYLSTCEDMRVPFDDTVLSCADAEDNDSTLLNFAKCHLDKITCEVLGKTLFKDIHLTHLDFQDCVLKEEYTLNKAIYFDELSWYFGLIDILRGLQTNRTVISLNLKGNSIKSSGAQALGRFLRLNKCLQRLNLDWNSISTIHQQFFIFCDGLAVNQSLKELSLMRNGLSYKCVTFLAHALFSNKSLETLNLSWNEINYVGGQAILQTLNRNRHIMYVNVDGNKIPMDIRKSIELTATYNQETQETQRQHIEEVHALMNKLARIETHKNEEIDILLKSLKETQEDALKEKEKNGLAISDFQKEFSEKKSVLEELKSNYDKLQTELNSNKAKQQDLMVTLAKRDAQLSELVSEYQLSLNNERLEQKKTGENSLKEIRVLKDEIQNLNQQVEDYMRQNAHKKGCIQKLNETLVKLEHETKTSSASFGDHVDILNTKHYQSLKEIEAIQQKDVERLKMEKSEIVQQYDQRLKNFLIQKVEMEKEISELKNAKEVEKLQHEEEIAKFKKQMEAEENNLKSQLEEKIGLIQVVKKKSEDRLKEQLEAMQNVQKKTAALNNNIEEKTFEVNRLQQCLAEAEEERKLEISKVKLEVKALLQEFEKLKAEKQKREVDIEELKKKSSEMESSHCQELNQKDELIRNLTSEIEKSEARIQQMLEEDRKRTSQLEMAFYSYFKNTKPSATELN